MQVCVRQRVAAECAEEVRPRTSRVAVEVAVEVDAEVEGPAVETTERVERQKR